MLGLAVLPFFLDLQLDDDFLLPKLVLSHLRSFWSGAPGRRKLSRSIDQRVAAMARQPTAGGDRRRDRWRGGGTVQGGEDQPLLCPLDDVFFLQARPLEKLDRMTPRELTVARLLSRGKPYKSIAAELNISPSTVNKHVQAIYAKLEIGNKAELAQLVNADHPAVQYHL